MENSILGHLSFNYKGIVIDEIALEGLEGIGLPMLWKRVELRISAPVTEKMKIRLWDYVLKYDTIKMYILPVSAPVIDVVDRFDCIHESTGYLNDPEDYLDGPYEYSPVDKEYGSCQYYNTRSLLEINKVKKMPYSEIEATYGSTLVLVAALEDRWLAIAPHIPITYLSQLTQAQYCILELIGRGRHNGQTTTGNTNLIKISKDPKLLFYNRKCLQDNDLIRVHIITQNVCGKGAKSLLLRLKRFHGNTLKSMPKRGMIRNIINHLLTKPGFCDRTDEMCKKGLMTSKQSKKLQKKVNIFNFEDREVPIEGPSKSEKKTTKRKFVFLSTTFDESSQSESEEDEPLIKCQYKVGVGILRQAYDMFLEAGLKGLTFMEIAQLLGIRFYTCRAICRVLKQNNLVREFLEDKGRQRKARYIAVAATRKIDKKYADEKKKLLNYLDDSKNANKRKTPSDTNDQNTEVPNKKLKNDNDNDTTPNVNSEDIVSECEDNMDITEVSVVDEQLNPNNKSFLTSKDNLTLRQLRYANGILKILNEKLCVTGFTTLSNMVAKEINEPPMVSKSMKAFIQKLVSDGYIKIYHVKWPGQDQRFSKLICAASVKSTDPVIVTKYKEIKLKAITKKTDPKRQVIAPPQKSYKFTNWPRYAKIQKLHESLINFAYFTPQESATYSFRKGFVLIADLIPTLTVQFVVSNISKSSITDEICAKINADILPLKLREAPKDALEILLKSNSFKTSMKENLKILAVLGLIQLVYYSSIPSSDYQNSSLFSFLVYVNRNAKILDTRGEWPRIDTIKSDLEIPYVFNSFADVEKFWEEVFTISINTSITVNDRKKKPLPPVRLEDQVEEFDIGERPGDGKGPCGYDSYFFMEVPWFWRSIYPRNVRSIPRKKLKPAKKILKTDVKKGKKTVKKKPLRKTVTTPKQPVLLPVMRKTVVVTWSKTEDMILMMCKIATSIMSPEPQVGSLQVRNFVARDLLSMIDSRKTFKVCHLRAKFLDNNKAMVHDMECILNYLRHNSKIMKKYGSVLRKIRLRHTTNLSRYINVARVTMLELVWTISRVIHSQSYTNKIECVARNYKEFHEKYVLTPSTANQQQIAFKLIDNMTVKETILMTVMLSLKCPLSNKLSEKILSIFSAYPETVLRTVIEQLRKSGVLVSKEKSTNTALGKHHFDNIAQSSYKISSHYQRKWHCRLNNNFVDALFIAIEKGFPQTNLKGTPELNCVMCEMQAFGVLEIVSTTVPVVTGDCGTNILQEENMNVIDVETKFRLKSGTLGWKNKMNVNSFSQTFEGLLPICEEMLQRLAKSYILSEEKHEIKDDIILHLTNKGEKGSTFEELKDTFGYTTTELKEKLRNLEAKNAIKRVGYYDNIVVLTEFTKTWTFKLKDENVIPATWLTLDKEIKFEIFFKWSGVVMNRIYENPGCSVAFLADTCEYLCSRYVHDICMFLERSQCINIKCLVKKEVDLFSDDEIEPEFEDYNEYSGFDIMLMFPAVNALTKYSYIRKKMLIIPN